MIRLLAASMFIAFAAAPAAAQWSIADEESVSLNYGRANDNKFSISCGDAGSEVVVVIPPGVKAPPGPVVLNAAEGKGARKITLPVELCGGETTCTDRRDGEVSVYRLHQKGKRLALDLATRATAFAIDAPGAKLTIKANAKIFAASLQCAERNNRRQSQER